MRKLKILLAGHSGYVGNIIWKHLKDRHELHGVSSKSINLGNILQCDLRDKQAVLKLSKDGLVPDIIIHAAGNKDINFCEKYPLEAYATNGESVVNLVSVFPKAKFIYVSTDYVFDGYRGNYSEKDIPNPQCAYGKSKLFGERAGLSAADKFVVVRLSALYDLNATFPQFLYNSFVNKREVHAYDDVIYSPTYYKDFLNLVDCLIMQDKCDMKIVHCCGRAVSRYEFAKYFAEIFLFDTNLVCKFHNLTQNSVLLPNLSLNSIETRKQYNFLQTDFKQALIEMRKDCNEKNYALSNIER